MEALNLVCPDCGSDDIGTREQAEIWQPARFTYDAEGPVETDQGRRVWIDWDAYSSNDVGDTETVGYFCRHCLAIWPSDFVPFVTREASKAEKS